MTIAAHRLTIERKIRQEPFGLAGLDHFQYREGEEIDPRLVVEQPTISLYCLDHDHRRAIFVETPPDVDLAQSPFYFQAQYDAALQLIAVPYTALHAMARDIHIDPTRIIMVYSTGRCGSTLISHALNQAEGVYGFAEPDALTQLVSLRAFDGSNDAEVSDLMRDCIKIMCAATQRAGATTWAFKPRSYVVELSDLVYRSFPEARVVFLYRNAAGWAKSFTNAFVPGKDRAAWLQQFWSSLLPRVGAYAAAHTETMPFVELLTCSWLSSMERCLDLQRQGVAMFCARYEDLKVAPREVVDAMFAYCDLTVREPARFERVLLQDSQAGTSVARKKVQESESVLTEQDLTELARFVRACSPELSADIIVPQTFMLQRS